MDWKALVRRIKSAQKNQSTKTRMVLYIRADEVESLLASIRALVARADRKPVAVVSDQHLAATIKRLERQITEQAQKIERLEFQIQDDDDDEEMNNWHAGIMQSAEQKRLNRLEN